MSLPDSMTYIVADGAGGPEVLKPATAPLPVPKQDEVLIRVLACGVNRPDVSQRQGHYRRRPAPARSSAWKPPARWRRAATPCMGCASAITSPRSPMAAPMPE